MERWRKPVIPHGIEETATTYSSDGHGWRKHLNWVLSPEDFNRVKAGYVCVNCMEPHEVPFPEKCALCGFRMKEEQRKMVEWEYNGETTGGSTTLREEMDRLAEEEERRKPRKSQILLPGRDF